MLYRLSEISADDVIPSLDLDAFPPLDDVFPSWENMFPLPEDTLLHLIDGQFSSLDDSLAHGRY